MKLADWMLSKDLDDEALASLAKVNRATISRLRRGRSKPQAELAAVLFELSGGQVTPNDFYDLPALPAADDAPAIEEAA